MALTVCVLASGSAGNCIYVASAATAVLVDAGLSGKELVRRLEQIGVAAGTLQAVCLTHEHSDHTAGLRVLRNRFGLQLFANSLTVEALSDDPAFRALDWNVFATGSPFQIGDLRIEPFSVPHDAHDPVGFAIGCGDTRIGIVTDMGMSTELIRQRLRGCRVLILEANHDARMVSDADRPWALKQRILSRQGHLSNQDAAELIGAVASPRLDTVYLAHLSAECNRPALASRAVRDLLGKTVYGHVHVRLTYPDRVSEIWREDIEPSTP